MYLKLFLPLALLQVQVHAAINTFQPMRVALVDDSEESAEAKPRNTVVPGTGLLSSCIIREPNPDLANASVSVVSEPFLATFYDLQFENGAKYTRARMSNSHEVDFAWIEFGDFDTNFLDCIKYADEQGATVAVMGEGCQISHQQDYSSAILDTDTGGFPVYLRASWD